MGESKSASLRRAEEHCETASLISPPRACSRDMSRQQSTALPCKVEESKNRKAEAQRRRASNSRPSSQSNRAQYRSVNDGHAEFFSRTMIWRGWAKNSEAR